MLRALFRKIIPGNTRVVSTLSTVPDAFSVQAASLGLATLPFSPMSAGRHGPRPGAAGFTGDRGYGVNRASGAGNEPVQQFRGLVRPVEIPDSQRLGIGYGPSGQPGLPSTGDQAGLTGSWALPHSPGMGG